MITTKHNNNNDNNKTQSSTEGVLSAATATATATHIPSLSFSGCHVARACSVRRHGEQEQRMAILTLSTEPQCLQSND